MPHNGYFAYAGTYGVGEFPFDAALDLKTYAEAADDDYVDISDGGTLGKPKKKLSHIRQTDPNCLMHSMYMNTQMPGGKARLRTILKHPHVKGSKFEKTIRFVMEVQGKEGKLIEKIVEQTGRSADDVRRNLKYLDNIDEIKDGLKGLGRNADQIDNLVADVGDFFAKHYSVVYGSKNWKKTYRAIATLPWSAMKGMDDAYNNTGKFVKKYARKDAATIWKNATRFFHIALK